MLNKGEQGLYVELTDSAGGKRYVLPNDPTLIPKLHTLLKAYPGISFVRSGVASITSDPDKSELDSIMDIEELPAKVDALLRAHMPSHPDTPDNFVRYSQQLIDLVKESEVPSVEVVSSSSSAPGGSLTDQLRNQVETGKSQGSVLSLPSSPSSASSLTASLRQQVSGRSRTVTNRPAAPVVEDSRPSSGGSPAIVVEDGGFDHEDYMEQLLEEVHSIAEYLKEKALESADSAKGLHAKVDGLSVSLQAPIQGEEITGEKLSKWFAEAAAKVGFDKAFEVLAQRIAGVSPEA